METTDLGYTTLHNQEVGIVYVQLDALKKILDRLLSRFVSIQQVFRYVRESDLTPLVG